MKIELKVEYLENYNLEDWGELSYAHPSDACMDLRAATSEPIILKAKEFKLIPNGFKAELISENNLLELQIRGRSGLAFKHGIGLVNGIGTIDYNYRGEFGTILINHSDKDFVINPGDRISQMAISPIYRPTMTIGKVDIETDRGAGSFGSTGKK